jgi:RNA polymerase sigma-32 factor
MGKQINNSLPVVSDDGNLARYIRQIQRFPVLSKTEEYEYAARWARDHDKLSAEMLVSSHLRLVVSMAYKLKNYGIPVGDLIASGNLGLMQALQKFEPEKGFRFSTYAAFWIKAEMYDLILNNWSLVRLGSNAARKKVFFNLAQTKRALGITDTRISDDQAGMIADRLDVPKGDVIAVNNRMHFRDSSLNSGGFDDGELIDLVEDGKKPIGQELEERELRMKNYDLLRRHLSGLPDRDREILVARRLSDPIRTLEDLSAEYGVSRERVRQIEERAFSKLRASILTEGGAEGI